MRVEEQLQRDLDRMHDRKTTELLEKIESKLEALLASQDVANTRLREIRDGQGTRASETRP